MPKYNKGRPIKYSVIEYAVPGYTAIYEENGNITNKYTPGKIGFTVIKSWKDGDNADSIRPRSITVNLLADGKTTGKTLVLNTQNSWRGSFTDLPEYENGVIFGRPKFFGIFGREKDLKISWKDIVTIGKDVVLINAPEIYGGGKNGKTNVTFD